MHVIVFFPIENNSICWYGLLPVTWHRNRLLSVLPADCHAYQPLDDFPSVPRTLIVPRIVPSSARTTASLLKSNTKSNQIKFYSFGGIQIRVDRSFKRPSESPYLPCLKYCMANSIMECLSELYSDLSDLVDLTLPVLGRISPVIGPSGSTFSKLPMEAAFTMVAGRADATAWGSWSLKIANLNSTYFTLNFSFIFSGKFSTVTWT